MTSRSLYRGYKIEEIEGEWRFVDTGEPTVGSNRPCGHCKKDATAEGHDGCIGTLPGVRNACCGHGVLGDTYVQMLDGTHLQGWDAVAAIRKLQRPANGNRIDHLEWQSAPRACWFKIKESDDWMAGKWHCWSLDHHESMNVPCHFPVGIVEDQLGHMHSLYVEAITFASDPEST